MLTMLFRELTLAVPKEVTAVLTITLFGIFIITPNYFIVNLLLLSVIGLITYTLYTLTFCLLESYILL